MSGCDDITDTEIADVINSALDDLDRVRDILGGLTVVLDDMRCRVVVRHEHSDNGRDGNPAR